MPPRHRYVFQPIWSPPNGRTIVVGAGKASALMAKAVEENWSGPLAGLVVTRDGHSVPCKRIEIVEASHPVPDARSLGAANRIRALVDGLGPEDLVLALISGGGSALLTLPAPGLALQDKQAVNAALLRSGASIGEMNIVRKHLSAIKGGRLAAAAHPAQVVTLVISGCAGRRSSADRVRANGRRPLDIRRRHGRFEGIRHYRTKIRDRASQPRGGRDAKTRRCTVFKNTHQNDCGASLEAAAEVALKAGITPLILGDALEGEARDVGRVMAGIARQAALRGRPVSPPIVPLSGCETTVTKKSRAVAVATSNSCSRWPWRSTGCRTHRRPPAPK